MSPIERFLNSPQQLRNLRSFPLLNLWKPQIRVCCQRNRRRQQRRRRLPRHVYALLKVTFQNLRPSDVALNPILHFRRF